MNEQTFDTLLAQLPADWKGPTIDVLDTARTVQRWCQVHEVPIEPGFLLEMTRMIIGERERQRWLEERNAR